MYRIEALNSLRGKLAERGLSAIIIPTNDPHFGEYTQNYYKIREWLSGFTGSAGTLVVTLDSAALWTDSRYFVQATQQLPMGEIKLMKLKMADTPTIAEWILKHYPMGEKIAIDKTLFSYGEYESLCKQLYPCTIELVDDFFSELWTDREELKFNDITYLDVKYSGESSVSKYERVVEALNVKGERFAYIISACDEVAWLCNIRGTDIEYNPLPQSYAIVTNNGIHLFANLDSISDEVKTKLLDQKIELHPYSSFTEILKQFPAETVRICAKDKITVRDYMALNVPNAIFKADPTLGGTINYFKSIKNNWEKEGFKEAFKIDGVAWCKVLKFIDDSLDKGDKIDEFIIGEKFAEYRSENELYRGESFEPIVAFGQAGALPHYSVTSSEDAQVIGKDNFLLMDTGGQYLCGTTDTTRTIPVGNLSAEQKRDYTLVLKGMIDLSCAKFPKGTRGSQLDILARGPLFNSGQMYFHGTGHGIGHYLCVHEGPQSIRMEENPVALAPGMVLSNEPAIYIDGKYGIRTENVLLVEEWKYTSFNDFYSFKTLTLVPIDLTCIIPELLTKEELDWVHAYNKTVCEELSPLLDTQTKEWLQSKFNQ